MTKGLKTGGRQKGTPNKRTVEFNKNVAETGLRPLEFMLALMRDKDQPLEVRMDMAKAAAPLIHPRLASTKVSGDKDAPLFNLSGLSDSELEFLRRTVLKATQVEE
jgi:hypothetical protein